MPIKIDQSLVAVPSESKIPGDVTLKQTIHTTNTSEPVQINYALSPTNNIVFVEGGITTKSVTRGEVLTPSGKQIAHQVSLKYTDSGTAVAWVLVTQTIIDSRKRKSTDVCKILLL